MKFQIWCTEHDSPVITVYNDTRLAFKAPPMFGDRDPMKDYEFEIDEAELYCLTEGFGHNFVLKIDGDKVILNDPPNQGGTSEPTRD